MKLLNFGFIFVAKVVKSLVLYLNFKLNLMFFTMLSPRFGVFTKRQQGKKLLKITNFP